MDGRDIPRKRYSWIFLRSAFGMSILAVVCVGDEGDVALSCWKVRVAKLHLFWRGVDFGVRANLASAPQYQPLTSYRFQR
jgi:hypothetical protein